MMPYKITKVTKARLAKTSFKIYEKFCWDGTKVRGAFRVKNTENHIDKIISGATQIAPKV
jgi:hypothetical protein